MVGFVDFSRGIDLMKINFDVIWVFIRRSGWGIDGIADSRWFTMFAFSP